MRRVLDLSGADYRNLDTFPRYVLRFMTDLESLRLRGTNISCFPPRSNFSRLSKLRKLDLSGTRIDYVPPSVLFEQPHLESVNLSGTPVWRSAAFVDVFADAAGGARLQGTTLTDVAAALSLGARWLRTLDAEMAGALPALKSAEEGFKLGLELLALMGAPAPNGGAGGASRSARPGAAEAGLLALLEQLVPIARDLKTDGVLIVPALCSPRDCPFLLVLHRTSEGFYSVTVCATGGGTRRHPWRRHRAPLRPGQTGGSRAGPRTLYTTITIVTTTSATSTFCGQQFRSANQKPLKWGGGKRSPVSTRPRPNRLSPRVS